MSFKKTLCDKKKSLRGGVAVAAVSGLLLLAACDQDSGTSAPSDDGTSDLEVIQSSSSSEMRSSSSLNDESSSSRSLSSSSNGWDWYVPKEARLNPEIAYDSMTDSRDGRIYKIVKIGDQTWMAENLNYANSTKTPSLLHRSWCYKEDDDLATQCDGIYADSTKTPSLLTLSMCKVPAAHCDVAGRHYTWAAAIDSVMLATDADNPQDCGYRKICTLPATVQGICPDGWHLPTKNEWETLFTEVGGISIAGKILKSQTGWSNCMFDNGNGTDDVGFSALPAGGRYGENFNSDGQLALFWSASQLDDKEAYIMKLNFCDNKRAYLNGIGKDEGLSVRCLKD